MAGWLVEAGASRQRRSEKPTVAVAGAGTSSGRLHALRCRRMSASLGLDALPPQ